LLTGALRWPELRNSQGLGRAFRTSNTLAPGWVLVATVVFILVFAVSAAPTPLYGVYQMEWKFSAIVLTAVSAAYALFLLVALPIFGSVSDHWEAVG
jgi:hypothetical protein